MSKKVSPFSHERSTLIICLVFVTVPVIAMAAKARFLPNPTTTSTVPTVTTLCSGISNSGTCENKQNDLRKFEPFAFRQLRQREDQMMDELKNRLKKEGKYDERYMAVTLEEAAQNFVDMSDSKHMQKAVPYTCDTQCLVRTAEIKRIFELRGQKFPNFKLTTRQYTPPPMSKQQNGELISSVPELQNGELPKELEQFFAVLDRYAHHTREDKSAAQRTIVNENGFNEISGSSKASTIGPSFETFASRLLGSSGSTGQNNQSSSSRNSSSKTVQTQNNNQQTNQKPTGSSQNQAKIVVETPPPLSPADLAEISDQGRSKGQSGTKSNTDSQNQFGRTQNQNSQTNSNSGQSSSSSSIQSGVGTEVNQQKTTGGNSQQSQNSQQTLRGQIASSVIPGLESLAAAGVSLLPSTKSPDSLNDETTVIEYISEEARETSNTAATRKPSKSKEHHQRNKRSKQSTSTNSSNIIGVRHVLYCSKVGYEEKPNLNALCGTCRAFRVLPEDYFPRYLNEVSCSGTKCLRDGGSCMEKYVNFDILHNVGTVEAPIWIDYTVSVAACCDCMMSSQFADLLQITTTTNA